MATNTVTKPARATHDSRSTNLGELIFKIVGLSLMAAITVWLLPVLIAQELWTGLASLLLAVAIIAFVYISKRTIPLKYILPGLLFLISLVVIPIIQTIGYSFTNYGDGTRGTKEEAIASIITTQVKPTENSTWYSYTVATTGSKTDGPFDFYFVSEDGTKLVKGEVTAAMVAEAKANEKTQNPPKITGELTQVNPSDVTVTDGRVSAAGNASFLNLREINQIGVVLNAVAFQQGDGAIILQGQRAFEGKSSVRYDAAQDALIDESSGEVYKIGKSGNKSYFLKADGTPAFTQSWQENVGWENYVKVLTNPDFARGFFGALGWTIAFAFLSVFTTFVLGLFLAVVLNDERVRGRKFYRSFLLLPYAVPGFISLLLWSAFYNRDFGLINDLLGGAQIDWLGNPWLAKAAVLLTNLWMGFPYMFVVCTGALQAIPSELKESASVDGASPWQQMMKITTPLLLVAVSPLLVASFAYNFNNFNAIQLLTGGGPFPPGEYYVGGTDILISMVYRQAFGGSGADFGLASAMSVLLFIITAVIATIQFRFTNALEDVN